MMRFLTLMLFLSGTVFSSSDFLAVILGEINNSKCSHEEEFQCALDDRCIPLEKRCNNINDCGDFSDEQECEFVLCQEPNFFKCKNKRCIVKEFVCDKNNDCEDYSDEFECEYFHEKLEANNNVTCEKGEWQCADKLCIPKEWVCNQEFDCLDESDEGPHCPPIIDNLEKSNHFNQKECNFDNGKFLCSDGKMCINLNNLCDGTNHCNDKSDEGPHCHNSTLNCSTHKCTHNCAPLPTGPRCLCPIGYRNVAEGNCVDINECEEYGICDQKCTNTPGSYKCLCEHYYDLQDDKRTCKAKGGEATMIFSGKTKIRSYLLSSDLLYPIANDLKHVVGVTSDGYHIYWSDVENEREVIVRAAEDGSNRETIVTSGLGLPEDIEVDYLSGNIYFTDNQKHHIGVCKNDGRHCTVLVNQNIRKPRGITLNINEGTMYWTDWAQPAKISTADMDGSNARTFLSENIHWPNGITLDYPNSRLYWTDAKKYTLESILLDGTDRRVILKNVVKHPFAIAVFENKLYWSNWDTHSIDSCDKFTGKNHHTLIKESKEYIYGLSIYHSALHQRMDNPCAFAFCSDICLLNSKNYSCACSEGRYLDRDQHTCKEFEKKQILAVAAKDILMSVEHKSLGKHIIELLPSLLIQQAGSLTYNSFNHSILISDLVNGKIIEFDLHTSRSMELLVNKGLRKVVSMDYDPTGNNLYVCDEEKATVEVFSLTTMAQKVIIQDLDDEVPQSIALVPQEGFMFIGFYNKIKEQAHIDRMYMDGSGRTHIVEKGLIGPIKLHFDEHYHRLFIADSGAERILHMNMDGDEKHLFKSVFSSISDITTLNSDLFWTNDDSSFLNWADKSSGFGTQKIGLDIMKNFKGNLPITSVTPSTGNYIQSPCQINNGNCSHLCLTSHNSIICDCPARLMLVKDEKHCVPRPECDSHEFLCPESNTCILKSLTCNGNLDCSMGEDEQNCKKPVHCLDGYFACGDGKCILEKMVCDHHFNCKDKSDEQNCNDTGRCSPDEFSCNDGNCVDERFVCDNVNDCPDKSDEMNCLAITCSKMQFRCDSGECIPKNWECDQEYDCRDFSDEHSQCESLTCSANMFTCANGKCIDKSLICDDSNDCVDNSDELNCHTHSHHVKSCNIGQFTCKEKGEHNNLVCLNETAKCNGKIECPEGDDEMNCSICGPESFECSNKKCISSLWFCDGTDDCGDHSDENSTICDAILRNSTVLARFNYERCDDGFRCKSGTCISLRLLCDGKNDCFDESDENGLCSKSCSSKNNPCQQNCIRTPAGPLCTCNPGFRLMGDGRTCKDINECLQDPPVCSQLCENTEGGFSCDCYPGFIIRRDKRSCKSSGEPLSIIYTTDRQIREIDLKDNSLRILYSVDLPKITSLDVLYKERALVFTMENSPTIQKINLDTLKRNYIEHMGYPRKIAYDWSTGNIYYYNTESDGRSINVCNMLHMACAKLIDIDINSHVSELVVDAENRLLFYSLTSWWMFNAPNYVLYKSNLDGSKTEQIVKSENGFITGLTYDLNNKYLYYANQHKGEIRRISYDGAEKIVLFTNITHPSNLKFFEDTLTFSTSSEEISKCLLYGTRSCENFKLSERHHELFILVQESLQPEVKNPCENNFCSHLCVASDYSHYKCVCEDGTFIEDKKICKAENLKININGKSAVQFHSINSLPQHEQKDTPKTSKTVIAVIILTILITITGIALIIYARKKRINGGKFPISMRFYNPMFFNRNTGDLKSPILQEKESEQVKIIEEAEKNDSVIMEV